MEKLLFKNTEKILHIPVPTTILDEDLKSWIQKTENRLNSQGWKVVFQSYNSSLEELEVHVVKDNIIHLDVSQVGYEAWLEKQTVHELPPQLPLPPCDMDQRYMYAP